VGRGAPSREEWWPTQRRGGLEFWRLSSAAEAARDWRLCERIPELLLAGGGGGEDGAGERARRAAISSSASSSYSSRILRAGVQRCSDSLCPLRRGVSSAPGESNTTRHGRSDSFGSIAGVGVTELVTATVRECDLRRTGVRSGEGSMSALRNNFRTLPTSCAASPPCLWGGETRRWL